MTITRMFGLFFVGVVVSSIIGCTSEPLTDRQRNNIADDSLGTLHELRSLDPSLPTFVDQSWGYAVFPNVGKGGLVAGGAHGYGAVYEHRQLIGYCELAQVTVGGQIGGQSYSELVVFEDRDALQRFCSGKITFGTNVSAIAINEGVAKAQHYIDGVVVFVHPIGGLMAEAVLSSQQFTFLPK